MNFFSVNKKRIYSSLGLKELGIVFSVVGRTAIQFQSITALDAITVKAIQDVR